MKIAVTSQGENLEDMVDQRFGRARYFIIYDIEKKEFRTIDNIENMKTMQGAGVQAAQDIIKEKVDVLLTGNPGPKAYSLLVGSNIMIFYAAGISVKEAIENWKNSKLEPIDSSKPKGQKGW